MASFTALPNELKLIVCNNLDDSASLKAFALTCRVNYKVVSEMQRSNMHINTSSNVGNVARRVLQHLFDQANSGSRPPSDVTIFSKGSDFADALIRHGSSFKSVSIELGGCDQSGLQLSQPFIDDCLHLIAELHPDNSFHVMTGEMELLSGMHGTLLYLLLKILQHLRMLEVTAGPGWSRLSIHDLKFQAAIMSTNPDLRIIRFLDFPPSSFAFWKIYAWSSLHTLEMVSMTIDIEHVTSLGIDLPISRLHLRNVYIPERALHVVIYACRALQDFEYALGHSYWGRDKDSNMAQLISDLRTKHAHTIIRLTIRTLGVRVSGNNQKVEGVGQLKGLKALALNEDHLHSRHRPHTTPVSEAIDVLSALPESLQKLDLFVWDSRMMTVALRDLLQKIEYFKRLPNLWELKMTVVLSESFDRTAFDASAMSLHAQVARIRGDGQRVFILRLDCLPPGSFEAAYQPPWRP